MSRIFKWLDLLKVSHISVHYDWWHHVMFQRFEVELMWTTVGPLSVFYKLIISFGYVYNLMFTVVGTADECSGCTKLQKLELLNLSALLNYTSVNFVTFPHWPQQTSYEHMLREVNSSLHFDACAPRDTLAVSGPLFSLCLPQTGAPVLT